MTKTMNHRKYQHLVREYRKSLKKFIVTSRFNNFTWKENQYYRSKNQKIGCIYCSPIRASSHIPINEILFVLEMNNDTNEIMGIGMVRNQPVSKTHWVYSNGNYNRNVYTGKYRIDRQDMTPEELILIKAFDYLCFKGSKHMKRGDGLKAFPIEMIFNCYHNKMDLVEYINNMFKKRIAEESKTPILNEN